MMKLLAKKVHNANLYAGVFAILTANCLLVLSLALSMSLFPASGCAQTASAGTISFPLQFVEEGVGLTVTLGKQDVKFRQEPDFGKDRVFRSALRIGPGQNDFMGFAVNLTRGSLHLDLNRNLDLTDDPDGIRRGEGGRNSAFFRKVRLDLDSNGADRSYMLQMSFSGRGFNYIYVASSYRGEIELNGRRWQLSVQDNLDGVIDRQDRISIQPVAAGTDSYDSLPAAEKLFLGGRQYQLGFTFESRSVPAPVTAVFTEISVPLGDLALEGRFIQRLVLDGAGLVILDAPAPRNLLPAGKYRVQGIYLHSTPGDPQLACNVNGIPPVEVVPGAAQHLKVGGPVESSVLASSRGSILQLDYLMKGAGGEPYTLVNTIRSKPPRFAIYKGDRQLATGNFEFG